MLKEVIEKTINNHYDIASLQIGLSEIILKEFLKGNAKLNLNDTEKILNSLNIRIDDKQSRKIETALIERKEEKKDKFKFYAVYWLKKKEFEVKKSTYCNYANLLKNNIIPILGEVKFNELNGEILQFFVYEAQGKKNLSQKTTKDCLGIVKQIIAEGQEDGIIPQFVYSKRKIKYKKQELIGNDKKTYTEEEYKKIIKATLQEIDNKKVGILLGLYTGMRIGELCALQFKDIDFERKCVYVNKTLQRTYDPTKDINPSEIKITSTKTESSNREIPLTEEMIKILKELYIEDDYYILTGTKKWTEPRTFRRTYQTFMKKIGIEPLKFHSLRHTFASINIENGSDIKTISEILGHSDIDVTLKVYTHTSQKAKRKAIEEFDNIFTKSKDRKEYKTSYKGRICCISKNTGRLDYIGTIIEVASFLSLNSKTICKYINEGIEHKSYRIIPEIEGITHKNGKYMGG